MTWSPQARAAAAANRSKKGGAPKPDKASHGKSGGTIQKASTHQASIAAHKAGIRAHESGQAGHHLAAQSAHQAAAHEKIAAEHLKQATHARNLGG